MNAGGRQTEKEAVRGKELLRREREREREKEPVD